MKKNLMLLLAAATVMASCSKESVVDSDNNKPSNLIGFSSYKTVAKGNPIDHNDEFLLKKGIFGVTAFISTSDVPYMGKGDEGVAIKSNGNVWEYVNSAEMAYWPMGDQTLDFYAYYPYNHGSISDKVFSKADGIAFTYEVPDEEQDQVDVMFATAKDKTKPETGNAVTIQFKHALTQVNFKVATKTERLRIDIDNNGIKLHNIYSEGRFKMSTNDTGWDDHVAKTQYTVTSTSVTGGFVGYSAPNFTQVGHHDNALMLIPQTIEPWTPSGNEAAPSPTEEGGYLSISCKIYQMLANGVDKVYLVGSENEFKTVYVPLSSKNGNDQVWDMSKKVTYNLLIGGGTALNPIEFDTRVENWTSADGGQIENR